MPRADHGTSSVSEARGRKSAPSALAVYGGATLLAPVNGRRVNFLVHNADKTLPVYIGSDATVTALTGIPVVAGETFEDITSYDEWWAIADDDETALWVRIIITTLDA